MKGRIKVKTEMICIRASPKFKDWMRINRRSPTTMLMERAKQLGFQDAPGAAYRRSPNESKK